MVRIRDLATGGLVVLTAVASIVLAPRLPAEMATHFDAAGQPDGYLASEVALAGGTLLVAGMAVTLAVLPRIDPLGENFAAFQRVYDGFVVATVGLLAYVHGLVLAFNLGVEFGVVEAVVPAIAAIYLLTGLLLWRAERNWFVGIRTPWTLSDERVWDRTHARTAPLFVAAAVLAPGALLLPEYTTAFLVGAPLAIAGGSILYSFVVYRRLERA